MAPAMEGRLLLCAVAGKTRLRRATASAMGTLRRKASDRESQICQVPRTGAGAAGWLHNTAVGPTSASAVDRDSTSLAAL